jgi:asparagine synthase (glutamine-hydrolysing)
LSGIVGIYHRNGAPIERALLQSLVDFLAYRGPDSRASWMESCIGLGHAMLRTTLESLGESQPASIEGRFWIVADARLDSREELTGELKRSGRVVRSSAPDSELILHAYAAWGTPCVEHLRGDFSFAVWDARNKQLFCARDHFGIKPFYYAQKENLFLFSNTLNCLRMHPEVSGELNEAAIGDFLLFGLNGDNATTSFRDIQRLPPAHSLSISPTGLQIRRYWAPPTDGRIRYTKPEDYVEHFQAILKAAVADRLRTDRVGILMSGGLDSCSVAAVAKEVSAKYAPTTDIRCYTLVFEPLIPDQEGEYAREVGEFLHFPVKFMAADHTQLFEGWDDPELSLPEPIDDPLFANFFRSCRNISADCRVVLSGEGSDNLLDFQMWPYARDLWRRGEPRRLLTEIANYLWIRPFPWRGIRARLLKLAGQDPEFRAFPTWLEAGFAERNHLQRRWEELGENHKITLEHPIHPRAHASLSLPQWSYMFELENAGITRDPLEVRYPFLDLRIVNYLFALPPFPWFFQKMLLREAMAGRIPERIRVRPKTPLQGDPVSAQLKRSGVEQLAKMQWSKDCDQFIERSAIVAPHGKMNAEEVSGSLRPYCLNIWLQSARRVRYNLQAEASNGKARQTGT